MVDTKGMTTNSSNILKARFLVREGDRGYLFSSLSISPRWGLLYSIEVLWALLEDAKSSDVRPRLASTRDLLGWISREAGGILAKSLLREQTRIRLPLEQRGRSFVDGHFLSKERR